jgi:hypothetical protein
MIILSLSRLQRQAMATCIAAEPEALPEALDVREVPYFVSGDRTLDPVDLPTAKQV